MPVEFYVNGNGQPAPAEPFPQEPGDTQPPPLPTETPPEPREDDPGAEPPPSGMEQIPEAVALAADSIVTIFQVHRYQTAMIEMLCGLGSMVNLANAAVRVMRPEDCAVMTPVVERLASSLRQLADRLDAVQRPTLN